MHAHIASFPSKVMYHSRLKSHDSVKAHLLRDLPNANAASEDDEKEILGTPVVFYDTAGCEYFERLEGDGDPAQLMADVQEFLQDHSSLHVGGDQGESTHAEGEEDWVDEDELGVEDLRHGTEWTTAQLSALTG